MKIYLFALKGHDVIMCHHTFRRQNISHNSRRNLAECGPTLGFDVMRLAGDPQKPVAFGRP